MRANGFRFTLKNKFHVTANSKEVHEGSIYFALKGAKFDGHAFIADALKAGASQIYSEEPYPSPKVIALGKLARKKLAELASEAYDHPTHTLQMIGVTGTSGKTTTTYLIQHILNSCGFACARVGTNGTSFQGIENETANTTPDALSLQKYFSEVKEKGATHVVMEVSSHALDQDRVWGIAWNAVTFLNLSPEHMDYHPTLEHYFETKAKLFTDYAEYTKKQGKITYFSANGNSTYGIALIKKTTGILNSQECLKNSSLKIECPLFGSFQTENILSALTVTTQLGIPLNKAVESLKKFPGVPGRMEAIANPFGVLAFVDYAHKPEALEKVLLAVQDDTKKIICVFGCGGDRDKTKRPIMGAIAARLSDILILTSDNPRTEDPLQILKEIESGIVQEKSRAHYQVIADRALAIQAAVQLAKKGDIVIIAGKGHENYQIFGAEKRHFDDREETLKAFAFRRSSTS